MPDIRVTELSSGASDSVNRVDAFLKSAPSAPREFDLILGQSHTNIVVFAHHASLSHTNMANRAGIAYAVNIPYETPAEREFREQKEAFQRIPPLLLEEYRGRYVISHDGSILDADEDLDTLTSRFFAEHGDMPVFLTKVGGEVREFIDTPFFD